MTRGKRVNIMNYTDLYLNIYFEQQPDFNVTSSQIKIMIIKSLLDLHGQVGSAIPLEILKHKELSDLEHNATLRIPQKDITKVWSAITMLGCYGNTNCAIIVTETSVSH